MKRKLNSFSLQWEEELSLRINIQKDWLRDHTSWAPCGIEMKVKGILKSWFWISLHQGTLFILCSRIQGYMLSLMNKVDLCLLLPLCVLYEMQNQIFQHLVPSRSNQQTQLMLLERKEKNRPSWLIWYYCPFIFACVCCKWPNGIRFYPFLYRILQPWNFLLLSLCGQRWKVGIT